MLGLMQGDCDVFDRLFAVYFFGSIVFADE